MQAAALSHGRLFENTAITQFEQQSNVTVQRGMGITVSLDRPYLACSPDGILDSMTLVEVKCPYSAKDSVITPETVSYMYLDEHTGLFALDNTHDYYYQIQGQLFVTKKNVCILLVYTFKDMCVIKVNRDDAFIDAMNAKLELFFNDHFKAALLQKFFFTETMQRIVLHLLELHIYFLCQGGDVLPVSLFTCFSVSNFS